jgi:hypothetical protein
LFPASWKVEFAVNPPRVEARLGPRAGVEVGVSDNCCENVAAGVGSIGLTGDESSRENVPLVKARSIPIPVEPERAGKTPNPKSSALSEECAMGPASVPWGAKAAMAVAAKNTVAT